MHTLSEGSQYKKATYGMTPIIWHLGKGKTIELKKKKISQTMKLGVERDSEEGEELEMKR